MYQPLYVQKHSKMTLTVNQLKHNHIKLITRLQENFLVIIYISYEAVCVPYEQWFNHCSQGTVCMAIYIDDIRL